VVLFGCIPCGSVRMLAVDSLLAVNVSLAVALLTISLWITVSLIVAAKAN